MVTNRLRQENKLLNKLQFWCSKMELITFTVLLFVGNIAGQQADLHWAKHGSSLYHFSFLKKTWSEAERYCVQNGGHLASILSNDENTFVTREIERRAFSGPFLGGSDAAKEGTWVWSDDSPMTYKNWNRGEPNNSGLNEHCLVFAGRGPRWNDIRCNEKRNFVCKKSAPDEEVENIIKWVKYGNNQYHFSFLEKSWSEAETYCVNNGGHLASIGSSGENTFVTQEIRKRAFSGPFLGGSDAAKERTWVWSDDSPMTYKNWNRGEPSNYVDEDCLVLAIRGPRWNDIKCNEKRNFVCKKST